MATRKNGKNGNTNVAKTEVVETAVAKTEVVVTPVVVTPIETIIETEQAPDETATQATATQAPDESNATDENETGASSNESEMTSIQWSSIKPELDDLEVDGLKEVIEYCESRITELQREEVEALEAQMRAIQEKLLAMKGFRGRQVVKSEKSEKAEGTKRNDIPLVNPNNPNEVYTYGRTPDWLNKLMEKTGKSVAQLREEATKGK